MASRRDKQHVSPLLKRLSQLQPSQPHNHNLARALIIEILQQHDADVPLHRLCDAIKLWLNPKRIRNVGGWAKSPFLAALMEFISKQAASHASGLVEHMLHRQASS